MIGLGWPGRFYRGNEVLSPMHGFRFFLFEKDYMRKREFDYTCIGAVWL
jgi:hypothetical protein